MYQLTDTSLSEDITLDKLLQAFQELLKRKELEYLESQFAEINRTYTTDETIEKDYQDYLRLKTEIDKLYKSL